MDDAESALSNRTAAEAFAFQDVPRLTAELRQGNEAAFVWLHRAWARRINRYCFALAAGDDSFAGEIAQATWLRLVKHVHVMPTELALWNWIARAARHSGSDLRRQGGRYFQTLRRFARFTEWWTRKPRFSANGSTDDSADQLLSALEAALTKLAPAERALIEGRYFAADSLESIGQSHALSVRAVEGRLARLRARLRQLIAEELKLHDQ